MSDNRNTDMSNLSDDDLELLKTIEKRASSEGSLSGSVQDFRPLTQEANDAGDFELYKIVEGRAREARSALEASALERRMAKATDGGDKKTSKLSEENNSPRCQVETPREDHGTAPSPPTTRIQRQSRVPTQRPGAYAQAPGSAENTRRDTPEIAPAANVPSPESLPSARPVGEMNLVPAQEVVDLEQEAQANVVSSWRQRGPLKIGPAFGVLLLLSVAGNVLFLVLFLVRGNNNEDTKAPVPTSPPMFPPTSSPLDYFSSLLPNYTQEEIEKDDGTPQARAFLWMTQDPEFKSFTKERLLDRFALAVWYYSTGGDRWDHNEGWLVYGVHECNWTSTEPYNFGEYNYDDDIINITGSRCKKCAEDYDQWCRRDISLFDNNLLGTIPPQLSLMKGLDGILVDVNGLSKTIPTEIGLNHNLKILSLGRNNLDGTVPTEIGLLHSLMEFGLDDMSMEGTIPTELAGLTALRYGYLGENELTGTIPSGLGLLTALREIGMGINQLTGIVPSELGELSDLQILWLFDTHVTGWIPSQLGRLTQIIEFYLIDNMLTGLLASELGNMYTVQEFEVSRNNLSGSIPKEFGRWEELSLFSLDDNLFTGEIPLELAYLVLDGNLTMMNVTNNHLSGVVPEELCQLNGDTYTDGNVTAGSGDKLGYLSFDCSFVLCGCYCSCSMFVDASDASDNLVVNITWEQKHNESDN